MIPLGNGDGTFQDHVDYAAVELGDSALRLAIRDFNRDGNLDIAAFGGSVYLLPGNADGTTSRLEKRMAAGEFFPRRWPPPT